MGKIAVALCLLLLSLSCSGAGDDLGTDPSSGGSGGSGGAGASGGLGSGGTGGDGSGGSVASGGSGGGEGGEGGSGPNEPTWSVRVDTYLIGPRQFGAPGADLVHYTLRAFDGAEPCGSWGADDPVPMPLDGVHSDQFTVESACMPSKATVLVSLQDDGFTFASVEVKPHNAHDGLELSPGTIFRREVRHHVGPDPYSTYQVHFYDVTWWID